MKRLLFILAVLTFLAGTALADYTETRNMQVSAEDVEVLRIDCGAGFLEIKGVEGLEVIEVKAEIFLDDMSGKRAEEFIEDYLNLDLTARGRTAKLVSNFEKGNFLSKMFRSEGSKVIDLTILVPPNIELRIDDGSGYIDIRDMEDDITIDDGSGDIICENIKGSLNIDDGSGSVELNDIGGDVDLDDGSGMMSIANVTGDVRVDDGSGNIDIRNIEGTVIVDDGSGNIRIDRVGEDVRIIDEGSGHCSITNVEGDIDR